MLILRKQDDVEHVQDEWRVIEILDMAITTVPIEDFVRERIKEF